MTYSSDRGQKIIAADAFVLTPPQAGAVTSCLVVTYCSGARVDAPFSVSAGSDSEHLLHRDPPIAYTYTRYATNTFVFAPEEDVRCVRIGANVPDEVKGNYYVTAVGLAGVGSLGGDEATDEVEAEGAWRVSEFSGRRRCEDFAWTTNVAKATPWRNGVTVPGFHAFRNGEAVTSIGRDSGRATVAGLYASRTEEADGPRTLSLLGSSGSDVTLELQVLNDRSEFLEGGHVAFDACQWTFPEGADSRTLSFAWAVSRTAARPAEGDWREDAQAAFASVSGPPSGASVVSARRNSASGPVAVPPGGALWLRWRVARLAGSPMLGVGRVEVTLAGPRGTVLTLR